MSFRCGIPKGLTREESIKYIDAEFMKWQEEYNSIDWDNPIEEPDDTNFTEVTYSFPKKKRKVYFEQDLKLIR